MKLAGQKLICHAACDCCQYYPNTDAVCLWQSVHSALNMPSLLESVLDQQRWFLSLVLPIYFGKHWQRAHRLWVWAGQPKLVPLTSFILSRPQHALEGTLPFTEHCVECRQTYRDSRWSNLHQHSFTVAPFKVQIRLSSTNMQSAIKPWSWILRTKTSHTQKTCVFHL